MTMNTTLLPSPHPLRPSSTLAPPIPRPADLAAIVLKDCHSDASKTFDASVCKDIQIRRSTHPGPDPAGEACYPSPIISRNHASISIKPNGQVYISDHSSRGTTIRRGPTDLHLHNKSHQLLHGDTLILGREITHEGLSHFPRQVTVLFRTSASSHPVNASSGRYIAPVDLDSESDSEPDLSQTPLAAKSTLKQDDPLARSTIFMPHVKIPAESCVPQYPATRRFSYDPSSRTPNPHKKAKIDRFAEQLKEMKVTVEAISANVKVLLPNNNQADPANVPGVASGLKTLEERLLNDLAEQRNLIKTLQAQIAEKPNDLIESATRKHKLDTEDVNDIVVSPPQAPPRRRRRLPSRWRRAVSSVGLLGAGAVLTWLGLAFGGDMGDI